MRGKGTRLNSHVMIGGGCAVILQENLATEPWVTTRDAGWIVNGEIPAQDNTHLRQKRRSEDRRPQLLHFLLQLLHFLPF